MICEAHYIQVIRHFGLLKTMVVLQKYFYWPNLQLDVGKYIISYTSSAIAKPTIKEQGMYIPLPTLSQPWESISMDYMYVLPSRKNANECVFVVVEFFFKISILAAHKKSITPKDTAKLLFEQVRVHFWIAQTIISNWDDRLLRTFFSGLRTLLDTNFTKLTIFHPQTTVQMEVVNQTIVHILCMSNSKNPWT